MKHTFVAIALALPFLTGCVEPLPSDPADACGASALQYLVGKPFVVLDGMRFGRDVRVIPPGMAVTMDYKADRLNIRIDDRAVIVEVACG